MQIGTKISGAAHLGLLGLALFGGAFQSDPLPFEVQDVSVISEAEYAALIGQSRVPDNDGGVGETPPPPEPAPEPAPEPVRPESNPQPTPTPQPVPTPAPEPEPNPEPAPEPEPVPEVIVDPTPPDPQPEPEPVQILQTPRPRPRPVDRVAPQPIAPPPPDVTPAPETTPAVTPDEGAETPQPEQEASAPEEANDRTVTEADETTETVALAPTRTARPPVRPKRPARPAQSSTQSSTSSDAVNAALAEALAGGDDSPAASESTAPAGPPLTAGEREGLRVAVSQCWNLGTSSSAAAATTVVVGVQMTKDGKPVTGSIRMLSYDGGSADAARLAFDAARRAIIRCGASGYDLPADKYDHWRDIEMTFNPERMRQR